MRDLTKLLKCLAHVKRLEIACLLHGHSLTVSQVAQMTGLRQATVSQHLILLKSHLMVVAQKSGKEIYYSLHDKPFQKIANFTSLLTKVRPLHESEPTVIDPVCKMHLTPSTSRYTVEYDGVRNYFCGLGCKKEFYASHKI